MVCKFRLLILKIITKICSYVPVLANVGNFFTINHVCVCVRA